MKQKRKVKSLLPQRKDRKTSFLTTLLLVLSALLCIGSATLLTSTVSAANVTEVTFTGLNDNMEAVYNLKFVDPENLSGDGVADVYVHNDSLYISPSPVIVSGSSRVNEVESGVYSHILGGENNTIYSDNVTIIAGYNNTVSGGANSTILGGMNNDLGTGAVLIGGRDNEIENTPYNRGIYLIGGKKVKVINSVAEQGPKQNIFVLGGDNSSVTLGSNIIIGGSGLKINTGKNIFAFSSPKPFTPMSSKTFYLNMENGVGIGTSGVPGGLAVNGAFMLLNEQSKILQCTGDNIGQIYLQDGCLIGCTKISSEIGAGIWEILNRSEHCKTIINPSAVTPGDDDYFYPEEEIPETPSYTGYCIPVDFTGHTRACSTPEVYQNVFFETSIVDQGGCNAINLKSGENKCVFECLDGYHLGYESVTGTGCYADCKLDGKPIRHNQTGTRYSKTVVRCSDGEQCEAKTLICKNGTLYYYSGGRMGGEANVQPLYKECTLYGGYDCQGKGYKIRSADLLIGGVQFSYWRAGKPVKDFSNNTKFITPLTRPVFKNRDVITVNAGTSRLARGYYQLCKDYNEGVTPITGDGIIKNPNTDCGTPNDYYKLIKCKPGYYLDGDDGMCHPKCSVYIVGEGNKEYMPGTIFTGYINSGASCPNDCEYAVFECKDNGGSTGVWEPLPGYAGKNIKNYKYRTCNIKSKICEGYYITSGEYSNLKNSDARGFRNSIYGECTNIEKKADGSCGTGDTQYKLTGCKDGYHTENRRICTGDIRIFSCGLTLPEHAKRDRPSEDYKGVYLASGHYIEEWIGGWSGGYWGEPQPLSGCDWSCVTGYSWDGKECVKNQCTIPDDTWVLLEGNDENVPVKDMPCTLYATKGEAGDNPCACICDYERNYFIENGACTRHSNVCGSKEYICISPLHEVNTGETASGYTWDCYLDDIEIDNCVLCKDGYTKIDGVCVINTTDTVGKCGIGKYECSAGNAINQVEMPRGAGNHWECAGTKSKASCTLQWGNCDNYNTGSRCERVEDEYSIYCRNFWPSIPNDRETCNGERIISVDGGERSQFGVGGVYPPVYVKYSVRNCFKWNTGVAECILTNNGASQSVSGYSCNTLSNYLGCYRTSWTGATLYREWGNIYYPNYHNGLYHNDQIGKVSKYLDNNNKTWTGTSYSNSHPPFTGFLLKETNGNLRNLTGKDLYIVANGNEFNEGNLLYKFRIKEWADNHDYEAKYYEIISRSRYGNNQDAEDFINVGIDSSKLGVIYIKENEKFVKKTNIQSYYTGMKLESTIFRDICDRVTAGTNCVPQKGDTLYGKNNGNEISWQIYSGKNLYIPGYHQTWTSLKVNGSGIVTEIHNEVRASLDYQLQ